ncbi:hypothetical protein [Phaffia rhodozyma]|uniref:Uncharacterized protein n=1 Tax=Phaffia rhodozyma TaxID=264483 RepID=A0A0F7SJS3_PHARH|nr:hypothetical protein [Phaffia rhodozyma]
MPGSITNAMPTEFKRTVMCEWGLIKEQTAENLRQAVPDFLGKRSAERMTFQIPAGETWASVLDNNWNDFMVGRTYPEVRVVIIKTGFEEFRDAMLYILSLVLRVVSVAFFIHFVVLVVFG